MNKIMTYAGCLASLAAFAVEPEAETKAELESEESGAVIAEVGVDFMSTYIWRGQILADAPVWQPSATLGYDFGAYGALKANVWSSFKLTSRHDGSPLSGMGNQEFDYTVSYAKSFDAFDLEVGHIWYTFPNSHNEGHTEELFATVAYNNELVTPTFGLYWDYRDNDDRGLFYGNLALSHDFEVVENLTVTPSLSLGLGSDAYTYAMGGERRTAFLDQTVGVSASYAVTESLSLGAQVNYTWIVDNDSRGAGYMGNGKDQRVWGGLSVAYAF